MRLNWASKRSLNIFQGCNKALMLSSYVVASADKLQPNVS